MRFIPHNDYVLVKRLDQEKNESTFTVPDHLKISTKSTGTEVVRVVFDSGIYKPSSLIAVEATMIEEFQFKGEIFVVVKRQHVKGKFSDE